MANKYVFNDGSLESKVLQKEIPDAQVIKVGPYNNLNNLNNWLVDVIEEDDETKFCYLHFCTGDLIRTDVDIRGDIAAALHKYPQIRIILPFEQQDKPSIERKALNYGIKSEVDKLIEENKEKFHFIEYSDYKSEGEIAEKDKVKVDYGKYRVGGEDGVPAPIGKEVASDTITPAETGGHEAPSDPFINKLKELKDKRRRKKKDG